MRDERGQLEQGDELFVLMNASHDDVVFRRPPARDGRSWRLAFDTAGLARGRDVQTSLAPFALGGHTLAVFVPSRASGQAPPWPRMSQPVAASCR